MEITKVFIIGAGRSGTTWLHLMLGSHPLIATGQETQIFENYLKALYERWCEELDFPESENVRKHGISSWIDEAQFIDLLRQFSDGVLENVITTKPGASIILEKSPNSSFNTDLMLKCYPKGIFIHLVRDGRDVCASMLAAKSGWGREWAPDCAEDAAKYWKKSVNGARALKAHDANYFEVRYEDLLDEGVKSLRLIFQKLSLDVSDELANDIYERFAFDKLKKGDYEATVFQNPGQSRASGTAGRPEPKGFFRKGRYGGWKDSLTTQQLHEIYWVGADLLRDLGYPEVIDIQRKPRSIRYREAMKSIRASLSKVAKSFLGNS